QERTGPAGTTIVTNTGYNVRGQVTMTSLPYFSGGPTSYNQMIYDPLGRLLQIINQDTTTVKRCYSGWVTVTIDRNFHRKRETRDAAGRLLKVEEYTGTFNCDTAVGTPYATTTYSYD